MICIYKYYDYGLEFCCTDCDNDVDIEFDTPLKDNSVESIEAECPLCGDIGTLLVLKCKDEFLANTLLDRFQKLKELID